MSSKTKKILFNGIVIVAILGFTFSSLLGKNGLNNLITNIGKMNPLFLFIALACSMVFVLCEAMNTGRLLKLLGYPISLLKKIKYASVGFFFSSITPSASGGQPLQLYFMSKDKIKVAHGSLVLVIELILFQLITLALAIIALVFNFTFLGSLMKPIILLVALGSIVNIGMVAFLIFASLYGTKKLRFFNKWIYVAHKYRLIKKPQKVAHMVKNLLTQYNEGAQFIKKHPAVLIKCLLTTVIQLLALYSIPFWIYKGFGYGQHTFFQFIGLQSIVSLAVSFIPLPGAMGVSEGTFLLVFKALFPSVLVKSSVLLTRFANFYFPVIVTGIFVAIAYAIRHYKPTIKPNNQKIKSTA